MQFTPWKCPKCQKPAAGTLETVPGLALLNFDDNGDAEYEGETKMYWNGQETRFNEDGKAMMECPNGHVWAAEKE